MSHTHMMNSLINNEFLEIQESMVQHVRAHTEEEESHA